MICRLSASWVCSMHAVRHFGALPYVGRSSHLANLGEGETDALVVLVIVQRRLVLNQEHLQPGGTASGTRSP